ncbi:MAG: DoxX family protein [Gemmatimonadales bacterium]
MKLWGGRILSGLAVLFLLWDGVMKLMRPAVVLESFARLGYPEGVALGIGILQLVCLAVYLIPRTSVLGAILLTGYLGGAVATHVRIGDPLFTHVLFPAYMGALLWGGLYLRDERLRTLIPLRSQHST